MVNASFMGALAAIAAATTAAASAQRTTSFTGYEVQREPYNANSSKLRKESKRKEDVTKRRALVTRLRQEV